MLFKPAHVQDSKLHLHLSPEDCKLKMDPIRAMNLCKKSNPTGSTAAEKTAH